MSFLLGVTSGGLVAGGVYYGFSNMIQVQTAQHRRTLHALSIRLLESPEVVMAPPPAASRIEHRPFATLLKSKWNDEVAGLFTGIRSLDVKAKEWGKKLLTSEKQAKDS